eukprot:gb/GFBE01041334.1/.p1 GENE.gb/GFBE01041334.1/~~gb/GFBE01041334.1/.p1  ORF type:complete len:193 (+),score=48.19 gb/GFBE01041334.1/:1-579(+)
MTKRSAADSSAPAAKPVAVQQLPPTALGFDSPGDALHGAWKSEKGKCTIGKDPVTARLSYTEPIGDGERVHGWLDMVSGEDSLWQGTLAILKEGQGPWYGPSFGPAPEVVGDIRVRLLKEKEGEKKSLQTQIKMADEDTDWSEPTTFQLEEGVDAEPMAKPNLSKILPMTQQDPGEPAEEEKETSTQKKVRR